MKSPTEPGFWSRTLRTVHRAIRRTPAPSTAQSRPVGDRTQVYDTKRLGLPLLEYTPQADDLPDPGEVVWTWVPYEEDPRQGKDRPVLVLARTGASIVVARLTSKDHDRDAEQEARYGRHWMDIGSGDWDSRHRDSEVRLDRLLQVPMMDVRRTGGTLDRRRYDAVVDAVRQFHS
jgi:hypothetical protein